MADKKLANSKTHSQATAVKGAPVKKVAPIAKPAPKAALKAAPTKPSTKSAAKPAKPTAPAKSAAKSPAAAKAPTKAASPPPKSPAKKAAPVGAEPKAKPAPQTPPTLGAKAKAGKPAAEAMKKAEAITPKTAAKVQPTKAIKADKSPPKPAALKGAKPAPEKAAGPKVDRTSKKKPAAQNAQATLETVQAEPLVKPPKAAKPAKAPKPPKPEKAPKLAPVAAALAKPMPAKPLAVAAGPAQPVLRSVTPMRVAPKPLAAPKPVAEPETVGDLQAVPAFKGKASGAKGMVMVGAVAGAFGVKGEIRLRAFTEQSEGVISYGPLYGEDGKVLLKPKSWRQLKDGVAVIAAEVKTREEAEKLRGLKLFVPRANLPAPAEDEFYVVDLLGCQAEALDGKVLGEICAVWNFGAGDIIEYRPPNGGPNVRITFTRETAPLVDLTGKRVVLDPPTPEALEK